MRARVCLLPASALGHKAAAFAATPRLSADDCVLTGGLGGFTLTCILPGPNLLMNYSNDKNKSKCSPKANIQFVLQRSTKTTVSREPLSLYMLIDFY